jgi:hypothetical protein
MRALEWEMKAVQDSERALGDPAGRPKVAGGAKRIPNPTIPYGLHEFLADHRRLAKACRLNLQPRPHVGGYSYDRFVPIHTGLIRVLSRAEEGARSALCERYAGEPGAGCRSRFGVVLRFLNDWHVDLSASGLVRGIDPMEVREDLVVFLLRYPLKPDRLSIPRGALVRFLDEIGHRWM